MKNFYLRNKRNCTLGALRRNTFFVLREASKKHSRTRAFAASYGSSQCCLASCSAAEALRRTSMSTHGHLNHETVVLEILYVVHQWWTNNSPLQNLERSRTRFRYCPLFVEYLHSGPDTSATRYTCTLTTLLWTPRSPHFKEAELISSRDTSVVDKNLTNSRFRISAEMAMFSVFRLKKQRPASSWTKKHNTMQLWNSTHNISAYACIAICRSGHTQTQEESLVASSTQQATGQCRLGSFLQQRSKNLLLGSWIRSGRVMCPSMVQQRTQNTVVCLETSRCALSLAASETHPPPSCPFYLALPHLRQGAVFHAWNLTPKPSIRTISYTSGHGPLGIHRQIFRGPW